MANKFDKPYIYINAPDQNKINAVLSKSIEMDTQDLLQYSMINKFPLYIVNDKDGNNLMHLGILNNKSEFNILNYVKFLVQQQVNPDQPNKDNQTPLHLACQKQYLTVVKFLLEQHVNINYQDNNGATPLHYLLIGDIKPWEEKEIKEFIVPNPKNKMNEEKRKELLELKKELWDQLNQYPFFEALQSTIEDYVKNSDEIKEKKQKYLQELANVQNEKEYEILSLAAQNDIKDTILTKWNRFINNDNIILHPKEDNSLTFDNINGIIKDGSDIKKTIKNKLKVVMKDSETLIDEYSEKVIEETDLTGELGNLLGEVLYDNVVTINIPPTGRVPVAPRNGCILADENTYPNPPFPTDPGNNIYLLKDKSKIELLTNKYKDELDENAYDFADNIIDLDNLSFIGGSRQITIDYTNYDNLKNLLDTTLTGLNIIKKKVIFILLIEFLKNYNFTIMGGDIMYNRLITTINNFDTDYNDLFDNELKNDFTFNYGGGIILDKYDSIIDISKEIYEDIFIRKIKNVGPIIYNKYVRTLLKYNANNNNLDGELHILFLRLVSALNNDPLNLEASLNHVFKIDDFYNINNNPTGPNYRSNLANWTLTLFNLNNTDQLIIDIINKSDPDNNKIIAKTILNYYMNMSIKFPKLYLLDLIYYILDPAKHQKVIESYTTVLTAAAVPVINAINKNLIINNFLNSSNIINNIFVQLPPSFQGYIYTLLEDTTKIRQIGTFYIYLNNKLNESIELGLLYNGCLPNLIKPISAPGPNIIPRPINNTRYIFNIYLNKINNKKIKEVKYFIFNPLDNTAQQNTDQDPNNFSTFNNFNTSLPFDYFYISPIAAAPAPVLTPDIKEKYFIYIEDRYRPPYKASKKLLLENQLNSFNKILKEQLGKSNNIIKTLLSTKQKMSQIYYEFYVTSKLIFTKQEKLQKQITEIDEETGKKIELFKFDNFTKNLNSINSLIFIYYYLLKKSVNIPDFIFYKLGSDKYKLYKSTNPNIFNFNDTDLIGGSLELNNLDFINEFYFGLTTIIEFDFAREKEFKLPPSLEDNLDDFYQLNKVKFIRDIITTLISPNIDNYNKIKLNVGKDNQKNLTYYKIAKLIEDIIKNYAEYAVKQGIYNILATDTRISQVPDINAQISILTKNTLESLEKAGDIEKNIYNFYKFSDPNINKECKFIIYPNEYTNTNLLQQKYCIKIDEKIICELLKQNAQPYLLDNNNISCLNSIIQTFNYKILEKYFEISKFNNDITFQNDNKEIYKDEIKYITNELTNHINKMINCSESIDCIEELEKRSGSNPSSLPEKSKQYNEKFVQTQYEEIKLLVLSDETYGNNLFYNLKNSFNICFYIMNEYLTDSLWCFDDEFKMYDFNKVIDLVKYKKYNIFNFYLSIFAQNKNAELYDDDKSLILNELKENLEKEIKNLEIKNIHIFPDQYNKKSPSIKLYTNKCKTDNNKKINDMKKIILKITSIPTNFKYKSINKDSDIIKNYDDLIGDQYYVYSSIWELLFSDKENIDNSYNLSLLKILEKQCSDIKINGKIIYDKTVEKYYDHVSEVAHSYFETTKYLDNNNVMKFIYELLVHLTKTQLCFGIEVLVRKTLYNHLASYISFAPDDLNATIEMILEKNYIYENDELSFKKVLYEVLPKKFVKNSVNVFDNLDEKVNFEPQTVLELLRELFESLRKFPEIESSDILLENLNKNIANYFDLFISRTIKNWYVVCENILKFVINQQRMTKTLGTLVKDYEQVAIVTVIWSDSATKINKVLVCRRGVTDELENTIMSQGGRVDPGETFEQAAIREAKEEAGIKIKEEDLKLLSTEVVDDKFFKNYYVVYTNQPTFTGPDDKHKSEVKNVPNILTYPTTNRLAFVPIDEILKENEPTYFTEILKKINTII